MTSAGFRIGLLIGAVVLTGCGSVLTPPLPSPTPTLSLMTVSFAIAEPEETATPTPASTYPTATPAPSPTPTPIVHLVETGDTLLAIAFRYGVTLEALQQENPTLRPQALQIGQPVIIPPGAADPGSGSPALSFSPTPLPLEVDHIASYETPAGGLWVLGEVMNQTSGAVENVQVSVTLYDTAGIPDRTLNTWTARDLIPARQSAPFGVLFRESPADDATYTVSVVGAEPFDRSGPWHQGLVTEGQRGGPAGAVYRVTGKVLNQGSVPAEQISVVVTLFDARNLVTGFRRQFVPGSLAAGASSPFDVWLSPGGPGTDHYSVAVGGRQVALE